MSISDNFAETLYQPYFGELSPTLAIAILHMGAIETSRSRAIGRPLCRSFQTQLFLNSHCQPLQSRYIAGATITFENTFPLDVDKLQAYNCYNLTVHIDIETLGCGCVFVAYYQDPPVYNFLSKMAKMTQRPLSSYSSEWKTLRQTMTPIATTRLYASAPSNMSFTFRKRTCSTPSTSRRASTIGST